MTEPSAAPNSFSPESLRQAFDASVGAGEELDAESLQRAWRLSSEYMAKRLLRLFDLDESGTVKRFEFFAAFERLVTGSAEDKLRFLFAFHDDDGDGRILHEELDRMIHLGLAENRLSVPPEVTTRLVDTLFEAADTDGGGAIEFAEFAAVFSRFPSVLSQVTSAEAVWATVQSRGHGDALPEASPMRRLAFWVENHGLETAFLVAYALANVALFVGAFLRYRADGASLYVQIARGGGACLNFNGALILLPMLRHAITWLRSLSFGRFVPVDESVAFHRLVGMVMVGWSLLHTLAHLGNYLTNGGGLVAQLFGTRAGATGVALMLALGIMALLSRDAIRRSGRFELFHVAHLLYWVWFPIALFHGPVFWIWVGVPVLGYIAERLYRIVHASKEVQVVQVERLASRVTHLVMSKPEGWEHRAGDYAFLCVPEIARDEWHPFTISSAPEQEGSFDMHVRTVGNWTKRLCSLAGARAKGSAEPLVAHVDGPYGTPSAHIFESKYAVLIGAGIGVTPFAALLQSILLRKRAGDQSARLEKVHFVWISRDQHAFEWFSERLAELEAEDTEGLLDIHIYVTSGRDDLKSSALVLARELVYAGTNQDLVTGLRARTKMGRPDWPALLREIVADHAPEPVDAYCCGPGGLVRALKPIASDLGIRFRHEVF